MIRIAVKTLLYAVALAAVFTAAHGRAQAASCTVNSPVTDLVHNYNPFSAPATLTVGAGVVQVTCDKENAQFVRLFLSGSATGYTTPTLTGPGGFTLSYTPCVPQSSGGCNATTNVWNATTQFYQFQTPANNGSNVIPVPSFLIFVTQQDAPYGTVSLYTGSLFFSTTCSATSNGTYSPC